MRTITKLDPDLAPRVADAIDLIHSVRFVAAREPSPSEARTLWETWQFATQFAGPLSHELRLRRFQKVGISSTIVAQAVRAGVFRVTEVVS